MRSSKVAWCHDSWNPWIGCREVSPECVGCYAREMEENKHHDFHRLRVTTSTWGDPYKLNADCGPLGKTAFIFSASMSDWFHADADHWRDDAWSVVRDCQHLTWLIPTKRPSRISEHLPVDWETNFKHVWLGTTCGARKSYERVDALRRIPCSRRFLSCEPLLEDISDIDLTGIGWVLAGGMSGQHCKTHGMDLAWAASLRQRCHETQTPFFFKQVSALKNEWGSNGLGLYLAELAGLTANPATVKLVREYPHTDRPLLPLDPEKGHRFTAAEWQRYKENATHVGGEFYAAKPAF
jgi:protein gp37